MAPTGSPDEQTLHDLAEETPQILPLAGDPRLVVLGKEVALDTGRPVCFQDWSPSAPTLTANTPHDWRFAGWGGACAGTGVTCAVVMDADKPISAA